MKILDVPQSGSLAGQTSARNRFGQYRRTRSIPVNPGTTNQSAARARLADNAATWRTLTDAQRAGWDSLGASMVRTDALGQSYALDGQQAFCSVNNNLLAAGEATVSDAPAAGAPAALDTATLTTAGGTLSVAYTPTPAPTGAKVMVYASPQRSAGRRFEKDLRLIHVSAAAAASPANILSAYTARFGAPVVGQRIFVSLQVHKNGFLSGPVMTSAVVSA